MRRLARWIWGSCCYPWGAPYKNPRGGQYGIRESIQLLSLVLTASAAFVLAIESTPAREKNLIMVVYGIALLIPIVGLVVMASSRQPPEGREQPANYFDKPTVRFIRVILLLSIILVVGFDAAAYFNLFPGLAAQTYRWEHDGKHGIKLPVSLDFPHGVPAGFEIEVTLGESLRDEWEIWRIDLVDPNQPQSQRIVSEHLAYRNKTQPSYQKTFSVQDRKAADGNEQQYELFVYLQPTHNPSTAESDDVVAAIREPGSQSLTARVIYPQSVSDASAHAAR